MIKSNLLFPLSFISLAFFILIFSALQGSQVPNMIPSSYSFSNKYCKKIYEASYSATPQSQIPAFPGILPNHPFYFAKMARDKAQYVLTKNPEKKLELLLLYADKRLISGQILILQKEIDIGISTITKAEKYLQKAGLYAVQNLDQNKCQNLILETVDTYLYHRQQIEKLLISDLQGDKKQILQDLQTQNNAIFEDKYANYLEKKESSSSADLSQ